MYIASYKQPSSAEILATIFSSNLREMREFLGSMLVPMLLCILGATFIGALTVSWCRRAAIRLSARLRAWILAICIGTPFLGMLLAYANASGLPSVRLREAMGLIDSFVDSIQVGYPFGILKRLAIYRDQWSSLKSQEAALKGFRFGAVRRSVVPDRQIYVLANVESSLLSQWQLFVYERPKTHEISRLENVDLLRDVVTS